MWAADVITATFAEMPGTWLLVSAGSIILAMLACSVRFGSSGRAALGDVGMLLVIELAMPVVLRSPLDVAHLHGFSLVQWSAFLGTALAIMAIVVHHRLT